MIQILTKLFTKVIPLKWYLITGGVAAMAFVLYLGYVFVTNMQNQLIELKATNMLLNATLESQKNTIEQIVKDNENINNLNTELQENLQEVELENSRLNRLFREHDLTDLASKKPGLIEQRINDATKKVFDDLESLTSN